MDATIFSPVIEEIKKGRRFIVVCHVNPEGDALGALLGLYLALKGMGKEAVAYLEDSVPEIYRFLPGSMDIVHTLEGIGHIDVTMAVDCGQLTRLGKKFAAFKGKGKLINIDHHITNDNYGDINIVVPEASAAGEIVYDLINAAGIKMTKDIATNLYVAIHTDTGSFRYSSSTPGAFIKAGELLRYGVDPWDVSTRVYENYPLKRLKLLGMALETLEMDYEGRIAVIKVTFDMLRAVDGDKGLVDGFVNYARAIEGVEVGVLFRECLNGDYKVSLRSKTSVDVSRVAMLFNGGGHAHAAGFNIEGKFEDIKQRVIGALKKAFEKDCGEDYGRSGCHR